MFFWTLISFAAYKFQDTIVSFSHRKEYYIEKDLWKKRTKLYYFRPGEHFQCFKINKTCDDRQPKFLRYLFFVQNSLISRQRDGVIISFHPKYNKGCSWNAVYSSLQVFTVNSSRGRPRRRRVSLRTGYCELYPRVSCPKSFVCTKDTSIQLQSQSTTKQQQ